MSVADPPSSSAANALKLLMMLAARGVVRVTTAADELGVAPSTAHRLLTTLTQAELAAQREDRCYVQGPAFARLRLPPSHPDALRAVVLPHLTQLSLETRETTHLVIREGTTVRFLHSVEGSSILRVTSRQGVVMPAHLTSGGKALLANLSDGEIEELYADGLLDRSGNGSYTVERLVRELELVRKRGYAVNHNQSELGISALGVAINRDHAEVAISISMPSIRYGRDRVRELVGPLARAAAAIQAQP